MLRDLTKLEVQIFLQIDFRDSDRRWGHRGHLGEELRKDQFAGRLLEVPDDFGGGKSSCEKPSFGYHRAVLL